MGASKLRVLLKWHVVVSLEKSTTVESRLVRLKHLVRTIPGNLGISAFVVAMRAMLRLICAIAVKQGDRAPFIARCATSL